jgi:hypothetical protein
VNSIIWKASREFSRTQSPVLMSRQCLQQMAFSFRPSCSSSTSNRVSSQSIHTLQPRKGSWFKNRIPATCSIARRTGRKRREPWRSRLRSCRFVSSSLADRSLCTLGKNIPEDVSWRSCGWCKYILYDKVVRICSDEGFVRCFPFCWRLG